MQGWEILWSWMPLGVSKEVTDDLGLLAGPAPDI